MRSSLAGGQDRSAAAPKHPQKVSVSTHLFLTRRVYRHGRHSKPRLGMNRRGRLIRLAVVDDHPVFRLGLLRLFERESDVSILWELDSLQRLDEMLEKDPVDVLLIDLILGPDQDALAA